VLYAAVMGEIQGMTIALNAGDSMAVLDFYTRVFERGPDTAPMDDFLEWQICPGTWLQLSTGHERPGANNARVRFEVEDLRAAVSRMQGAKVPVGEVVTVPGVVAFSNFSDHWGNALGFYQMLAPRNIISEAERRRQDRERQEELEYAVAAAAVDGSDAAVGAGGPDAAEGAVGSVGRSIDQPSEGSPRREDASRSPLE
jgi:hypothetical protein